MTTSSEARFGKVSFKRCYGLTARSDCNIWICVSYIGLQIFRRNVYRNKYLIHDEN